MEIWKDIKGYEGLYQVSNLGRVKNRHNKFIKPSQTKHGYLMLHLWKCGKSKPFRVHRLVAEAFIPNPENKAHVGHLKTLPNGLEDKTANEVWNLAWMTPIENANYGTINERKSASQKGKVFTEEHRKNISNALEKSDKFQKAIHSHEFKEKLRDAQKDKPQLNRKDLSQPICQYTLDGAFVATYPSAKQAARELGVSQCNISRCCNGGFFCKGKWINLTQAYGFIWKKALSQP